MQFFDQRWAVVAASLHLEFKGEFKVISSISAGQLEGRASPSEFKGECKGISSISLGQLEGRASPCGI